MFCESFKDDSLLCSPQDNPSNLTSCGAVRTNQDRIASPTNDVGIIVGSGYAKDICLNPRFNFPFSFYEMINLNGRFDPDNKIHIITLFCRDIDNVKN